MFVQLRCMAILNPLAIWELKVSAIYRAFNVRLVNEDYVLRLAQVNMGVISTFIKAEQIQLTFIAVETERSVNFCRFMV